MNPVPVMVTLAPPPDDPKFGLTEVIVGTGTALYVNKSAAEVLDVPVGVVTVTDAEGRSKTYRAGDAFVTPKGFSGTWDVIEPVRKHFTYYGAVD